METAFRGGLMDMRLKKTCVPLSDMLLKTNGALTQMTLTPMTAQRSVSSKPNIVPGNCRVSDFLTTNFLTNGIVDSRRGVGYGPGVSGPGNAVLANGSTS